MLLRHELDVDKSITKLKENEVGEDTINQLNDQSESLESLEFKKKNMKIAFKETFNSEPNKLKCD